MIQLFFWMHKNNPIPPPPPGFGPPDVLPHQESPNCCEYNPGCGYVPIPKKKSSLKAKTFTDAAPPSINPELALQSISQVVNEPSVNVENNPVPDTKDTPQPIVHSFKKSKLLFLLLPNQF